MTRPGVVRGSRQLLGKIVAEREACDLWAMDQLGEISRQSDGLGPTWIGDLEDMP